MTKTKAELRKVAPEVLDKIREDFDPEALGEVKVEPVGHHRAMAVLASAGLAVSIPEDAGAPPCTCGRGQVLHGHSPGQNGLPPCLVYTWENQRNTARLPRKLKVVAEGGIVPQDPERLTISLTPRAATALQALQASTGHKKVDIVNQALRVYQFLDELQNGEQAIFFGPKDGAGPFTQVQVL